MRESYKVFQRREKRGKIMKKILMSQKCRKKAMECLVVTGIMGIVAYGCGMGFGEALYHVLYY